MAFPLKSGADLYNNQLIRAAIWNYSADIIEPSELVTGLIYFNTSNSSAGKKLRLYTGSAWKTLAFEEDLDVANNAEFKALEDKVKLLSGEVDTDAIINNMKDVENFLAGFNESGGTLMNYLKTELGKKLDLSGGTIRGSVAISGNEETNSPLNIVTPSMGYTGYIRFGANFTTNELGYLGFSARGVPAMMYEGNVNTLLHEGNVGEYNAGGLVGQYIADLNNATANKIFSSGFQAANIPSENYATGWTLYNDELKYTYQLAYNSSGKLYSRYKTSAWSDWKTIAFTDSNVASATKLETPRTIWGQRFDGTGDVSGDLSLFQSGIYWHRDKANYCIETEIRDNASPSLKIAHYGGISFYTKGGQKMLINSSGNVLIGTPEDNGAKLQVSGDITADIMRGKGIELSYSTSYIDFHYGNDTGDYTTRLIEYTKGILDIVGGASVHNDLAVFGKSALMGNVGIGLPNPEHKLHVGGDIVANGTIACKGIAAEGSEVGMGTVDKKVLSIPSSTTQQTFSLTHGLNTREITVCIYEVTSTGTNMILTDVEITGDNTISVSFGNPPTDNHMVVVMG